MVKLLKVNRVPNTYNFYPVAFHVCHRLRRLTQIFLMIAKKTLFLRLLSQKIVKH